MLAAEEMATVAEYVPGARFSFTDAVTETGVVPPPLTVSQLSPLFIMAVAVTCCPDGLLKTAMLCAAGGLAAPCVYVKLSDRGATENFAALMTFMVTDVVAEASRSAM